MEWNDELMEIYQRQILLKDVGVSGVERILDSKILVVGAGAIACSALQYLASTGVGNIGILGDAVVENADISTQILYTFKDVGKSKLSVLKSRLKSQNPHLSVKTYKDSVTPQNFATLVKIVKSYDIVLDCSDSFVPKMLVNAVCIAANATLISGGVVDLSLQILSVKPRISACYSCIFGVSKGFLDSILGDSKGSKNTESKSCENAQSSGPTCAKSAMIGSVAGISGSMMATEAIKILCDIKTPLFNNFLTFHTREMKGVNETIERKENCPVCGDSK
ncbi:hypothetical protein DCO58_06405 [Helicobacter saguini]|uniref:HesA/MoeB/ThiF family protein n=1 Tax=Helicobacter saguini TaxID=1548018 RepID=A0A347VTN2_9HELI|nr:HesA/MoeB/ThiF family protein [Helicobacter saguini]MWV62029.1 hypothetical protein [Helicobacter saguini]MWV67297.1 hypothetical protein [Helicobacter saguini]MWV69650.1 hypothetical protein [Helicobacter saguini]MWV73133.1 hypothetical protein [Helicobacter saguini]TLD95504.1 HesA/MoeB/ThiF family protein [Helicobacter saguini]